MVVYTMTKKQLLRIAAVVLFGLVAALLIIFAVANAVTAGAEEPKKPIYSVERGDGKIALTFDCAWGNSNTDALLSILEQANARATFFVTGEFCDKYPDDVRKLAEAGHSVQNHSDLHPHVKGMNINDLIADTRECSRKIKMLTGKEPTLYRAPYGEYDDTVLTTIEGMGLKAIQWSADSIDWEDPDAATIKKRILSKTESGSILLFHNDLPNTEEALPSLLTELLQKGFEFVKTEDLIYYDSYRIDNTGKQIYEPDLTAASSLVIYADDAYANAAFEKIRLNLTLDEIYTLSTYTSEKVEIIEKTRTFLSDAEIAAIQMMSFDELYEAYGSLVYAAETYGAGELAVAAETEDESGSENETATDPSENGSENSPENGSENTENGAEDEIEDDTDDLPGAGATDGSDGATVK
ncbi:MAG: polysaccharide deacetylase family protein [Bacteroides sp.]|nr:polysaccharide deacetylase family protein [Eubacterium sp.]MCM1419320.1 polysaccharide deacetylase family protein [Roseburia sp.]MCM1463152.1 polysaccharide deacetylase family protein [Bacteroides sp.]